MNKHRYRLIFNQARGLMMAVAEHVSARHGGGADQAAAPAVVGIPTYATLTPVALGLMVMLGTALISMPMARAGGIIADPTAPGSQQPIINTTASGVPLVNIQTPSAAGVSRNTYSQFDVNTQGAILNNSAGNVQTQLGGWVQGNPNLAGGTARVILNEVNSSNPSLLNGFIEIAGSRAQLVIANPSGISCSGCGFINANRTTLTTGTPVMSGGDLTGYLVRGGTISVQGNGLNDGQSSYTDLLARAVEINAGIWASTLNITTGTNQINVDTNGNTTSTRVIAPTTGTAATPAFAIDISALGGMYAGKIHLIGTEAGLGVRNAGTLGASAGEFTLTSEGELINSGRVIAQQSLIVEAKGGIQNQSGATLYTQAEAQLTTQGVLATDGLIGAGSNLRLSASQIAASATSTLVAGLNADGTLNGTGTFTAEAAQQLTLNGQALAGNAIALTGTRLDLDDSVLQSNSLSANATDGIITLQDANVNTTGAMVASATEVIDTSGAQVNAQTLTLAGQALINQGGELVQTGSADIAWQFTGDIDNTNGRIATNSQNLTLTASSFSNQGGTLQHAGSGDMVLKAETLDGTAGNILSNGNLAITTQGALVLEEATTEAKSIQIVSDSLSHRQATLLQTGNGTTTLTVTQGIDNTSGQILSNGNMVIQAASLSNEGGQVQASGSAELDVTQALNNTQGRLVSGDDMHLTAGSLQNANGTLSAGGKADIQSQDDVGNANGSIVANNTLTIHAAALDNTGGTLGSVQEAVSLTASDQLTNTQGRILSETANEISANGVINQQGIIAGSTLQLDSGTETFDNTQGKLSATGALTLDSGELINDGGLIQAGGNLTLDTHGQSLDNQNTASAGGIIGQGRVTINSGTLDNSTGYVGAAGNLDITATNLDNQSGTLVSQGNSDYTLASLDNQQGTLQSRGGLDISSTAEVNNQQGLIQSGGDLSVQADTLDNQDTAASGGIAGRNVTISTTAVNNTSGAIVASEAMLIKASQSFNNTSGYLGAQGSLRITDQTSGSRMLAVTNTNGTLISGQSQALDVASLTGDGEVLSYGNLDIQLSSAITNSGTLQANGTLNLTTSGDLSNSGKLIAGQTLTLTASTLDNTATGTLSGGDVSLAIDNALTNRGLIDGGDTFITANSISNLGSGRIYGDHLAIQASSLTNSAETIDGVTTAGTIAARDRLDVGATMIENLDGALIYSAGDMAVGGQLDNDHLATGKANSLVNRSASIEVLGSLRLSAASLVNERSAFTVERQLSTDIPTGVELLKYYAGLYFYWTVEESSVSYWRDQVRNRYINNIASLLGDALTSDYRSELVAAVNAMSQETTRHSNKVWDVLINKINTDHPEYIDIMVASLSGKSFPLTTYDQWCVDGGECSYVDYIRTQRTDYKDVITSDAPSASILVGGNAQIAADTLVNRYSTIEAGGNMALTGSSLTNEGAELFLQSDYISRTQRVHWVDRDQGTWTSSSSTSTLIGTAPGIISAGGTLVGSFTDRIDNTTIRQNTAPISTSSGTTPAATTTGGVNTAIQDTGEIVATINTGTAINNVVEVSSASTSSGGTDSVIRTINYNPTVPASSLFSQAPSSTSNYLIQTDPQFANYKSWLSSDYMLTALSYDPAITTKRLGDGFYEQQLIRDQISQLTGRRFLDGYSSDEAQYQALMAAGVTAANEFNLTPGVALTEAQIAQLTSDIVWLVEQTVTLQDGTVTQALVPQVYVKLQDGDLSPSGAVLAGNNVGLEVTGGDIKTSGTIAGRQVVSLNASNIENVRGLISGNDVGVTATEDITIEGGIIKAQDSLIAQAGNDITVKSSTVNLTDRMQDGSAKVSTQVIDRVAGLYVSNPNAVLVASAGNDINLMAAVIQNSGANTDGTGVTALIADNDVNIGVVTQSSKSASTGMNSWSKERTSDEIGSLIQTTGDIEILAEGDIGIKGANIVSDEGALTAVAGGDITVTAAESTYESDAWRKVTTSSRKKEYSDSIDQTTHTGSVLSADTVTLQAGNSGAIADLTIEGSTVVSTAGTLLRATGDVTIAAVEDTLTESHLAKIKQSGFSASSSGIGYSSSKLTQSQDSTTVTQVGSTVGSLNGDVTIVAGKTYTQSASDVLTPEGSITVLAKKINIEDADNTSTQTTETKYKQSGFSLNITNPVIAALQTADQMVDAASNTSDSRLLALAAATTTVSAVNAYDAVTTGQGVDLRNGKTGQIITGKDAAGNVTSTDATAADKVGGVNVSLSFGTSSSKSSSTQTSSVAQGSSLQAGGDITLIATGDGKESDINITGSTVNAGNIVRLKADDQINLLAAQNIDTLTSSSKSSSFNLGVSAGVGTGGAGPAVTVGGSTGKGSANGTDVTWTETQVTGGNKVIMESGTDTNIIGSQVWGNQVITNVGTNGPGQLNIVSLQDTSTYDSKQNSVGGSITVGTSQLGATANISNTKINSDYASVNEQAGIYAGDGGFQVNVNGQTNLIGGVVASTQEAIDTRQNSFITKSLTLTDIENKAEYEASKTSIGVGYGTGIGKDQQGQTQSGGTQTPGTTLPGLGGFSATTPIALSASGEASSTTVSGISGGTLIIGDSSASTTTINRDVHIDANGNAVDSQGNSTAGTLTPIYTEETQKEIEAGFAIVSAFINETSTFLDNRAKESTAAQNTLEVELAKDNPDPTVIAQATQTLQDNQMWEMGGSGRIALTAITGAFSGNITGTSSDLVKSAAIITLQSLGAQEIKDMADALGGEGSAAHTALHAILACGGAAASGSDCGTAALASTSGVVLNKLFDSLQGSDADSLTPEEREARAKLINTVVTGITAALGGETATAQIAAQVETENNALIVIPIALELIDKGITAYDAWQLEKAIKEGRTADAEEIAAGIAIGLATEAVPGNKILQKIGEVLGKRGDDIVKGAEEIVVQQRQKTTEVANLFDKTNPQNGITIGNRTLLQRPGEAVPIFDGATEKEVKDYFLQLTGKAELPNPIKIPGKNGGDTLYVIKTDKGNFVLRDFADSTNKSGSVWTIEIPKSSIPTAPTNGKTVEIKFGR